MSEKRECPNCKAYVSQVYYAARHDSCGWFAPDLYEARYRVVASALALEPYATLEFESYAETRPTAERLDAFVAAALGAFEALFGRPGQMDVPVVAEVLNGPEQVERAIALAPSHNPAPPRTEGS